MTELESPGRYLYGGGWKAALASALGVNLRTVQRWVAGFHMPDGAWNELLDLVAHKHVSHLSSIMVCLGGDSITLSVGNDKWSEETDRAIKERMAEIMRGMGYRVVVV